MPYVYVVLCVKKKILNFFELLFLVHENECIGGLCYLSICV